MNKAWHEKNKMSTKPSDEQRAVWHIEHLKNCDCRKPSPNVQKLIEEYKNSRKYLNS